MKRIGSSLLIISLVIGLSACGNLNDNNAEESTADMQEQIGEMKEQAVKENSSVSVATNTDKNGELKDYIDISIEKVYVETDKITNESIDELEDVIGAFIDEKGNLLDNYSFVAVKLKISSEKNTEINTGSFLLRGIKNGEYLDAECFYQDGKKISGEKHESGIVEVQKGITEITVGFFADEDMMNSEQFFFIQFPPCRIR